MTTESRIKERLSTIKRRKFGYGEELGRIENNRFYKDNIQELMAKRRRTEIKTIMEYLNGEQVFLELLLKEIKEDALQNS